MKLLMTNLSKLYIHFIIAPLNYNVLECIVNLYSCPIVEEITKYLHLILAICNMLKLNFVFFLTP